MRSGPYELVYEVDLYVEEQDIKACLFEDLLTHRLELVVFNSLQEGVRLGAIYIPPGCAGSCLNGEILNEIRLRL